MNKKEFLSKLRKRLKVLNENEIEDIIEEYEGHINEKVSKGKTEKEAIDDFGDFDLLVKDILSAYKINTNYEDDNKDKNIISDFIDSFITFISDFIKNISNRSKKDIIKFIFEFIILLLFITILKFPVIIIEKIGMRLFNILLDPFSNILGVIWKYMIEFIYLILSILGIISFVKKRYINVPNEKEYINESKKIVNKINTKKKDDKIKKSNSSIANIIITLLKVCLIFIVIPAVFSFLAVFVVIIIGIVLLIQKVPYLGIFLCCLTYLILNYLFLDLSFRFIFNKKINTKALLIVIISTIIIFSIGIGLSFYELVNTTYINDLPASINKVIKQKEEIYSDNLKLTCDNIYHTSYNYEVDDTLGEKVVATVTYYNFYNKFEIDDNLKIVYKDENNRYEIKSLYNLILNSLRKRTIYNYNKIDEVSLTITLSSNTKNKLLKKEKNLSYYDDYNCTLSNEECYED